MLEPVPLRPKSLDKYEKVIGVDGVERLRELARPFAGARVLHVNATSYGGGVAELLSTLVPLMQGVGMDAHWHVMYGSDEFFNVTKSMHNALQGMEVAWTPEMERIFRVRSQDNAARFDGTAWDFVVIHDPQPAAVLAELTDQRGGRPPGKWIWRCHIDTAEPFAPVADFLFPLVEGYDAAVFTMQEFVPDDRVLPPRIELIAPCIDPVGLKNVPLGPDVTEAILDEYGIDPARPMLCQISRFDPWKDPLGVIDAYRLVKLEVPEVQLVLAGSMATDDPEGMHYLARTETHAQGDPDVFLLTNAQQVGSVQVNAFQACADVVIQKSLREGFGLTVAEGMWKERPVIGGRAGGITLQIEDGHSGFLVETPEECARRILELLTDGHRAAEMGAAGRERVRDNFVMTVLLERWLRLFASLP